MKAISLWQPWASAIAVGSKRIETRGWATKYRGPLLIHAAQRKRTFELIHIGACWNWNGALRPLGAFMGTSPYLADVLPFGAVIARCELIDCKPTAEFTQAEIRTPRRPAGETSELYDWTEAQLGDFTLGRYGWILDAVEPLEQPLPYRGAQGLFNVPDHLLQGLAAAG